jgi:dephospho-CoA kinase
MKVIGLTGGIGSGKSTVSKFLAELGAMVIDADKVGHEVFQPGTDGWNDVVATFGKEIITDTGEIDRKKLGAIVFNNPEALSRLNQIIHPRAYNLAKSRLEEYRRQGIEVLVLEVILLIEAKWTDLVDEIWVVIASKDVVVKRLKEQRGMSEGEILARIHSQMSKEERTRYADVIINNDGDLEKLKEKVKELWEKIKR